MGNTINTILTLLFVTILSACQTKPPQSYDALISKIEQVKSKKGFIQILDCEDATLCFSQDNMIIYEADPPSALNHYPTSLFVMNDYLRTLGLDTFMGNIKHEHWVIENWHMIVAQRDRLRKLYYKTLNRSPEDYRNSENLKRPTEYMKQLDGYFLFEDKDKGCTILAGFTVLFPYHEKPSKQNAHIKSEKTLIKDKPLLHRVSINPESCGDATRRDIHPLTSL